MLTLLTLCVYSDVCIVGYRRFSTYLLYYKRLEWVLKTICSASPGLAFVRKMQTDPKHLRLVPQQGTLRP